MFGLDLKSGVPICDQIVNGFIKMRALGLISGGEQMPSVRSLALKFSINPNTVQKAYAISPTIQICHIFLSRRAYRKNSPKQVCGLPQLQKMNLKNW